MSRTVLILSLFVVACAEAPLAEVEPSPESEPTRSMVEALPPPEARPVAATVERDLAPEPELPGVDAPATEGGGHEVQVRPGESLVRLAGWTPMNAEDIAEYNGISVQGTLYPGETLRLPLTAEEVVDLERSRTSYQDARLERYLGKRGGLVGVDGHRVGTGETAWGIARAYGELPMWVVSAFNSSVDLDRLRIGDVIHLPVLGDTVTLTSVDEEILEVDGESAGRAPESEVAPAVVPDGSFEEGSSSEGT